MESGLAFRAVLVRLGWVGLLAVAAAQYTHGHGEKGDIAGISGGSASNSVEFPTHRIEVLSHLSLADIGGDGEGIRGNDCWGWTDPQTGREYALFGRTDGVAFIDITFPRNPVYLGILPKTAGSVNTIWRDFKTYQNRVYIVADNTNNGLQVFDLTELRDSDGEPTVFEETARYDGFQQAHNIAINESTGFAYPVGAFDGGNNPVQGAGLVFLNLNVDPTAPGFNAGGFAADGYTHDTQVVTYQGFDQEFVGDEIAFSSNEDTLTIVNLENKASPSLLARVGYGNAAYVHQGWLTPDHRYFLSNDELDELENPSIGTTRTHIWNLDDLRSPHYLGFHDHGTVSIDHNLYIHDGFVYAANYTTGLRVLSVDAIGEGKLGEVAWLDTHPVDDELSFKGAWSVYPFFESETIVISDINEGLILARLTVRDYDEDLTQWRERYFSAETLANPALENTIWGLEADPDGDGMNNFLEFALDSNPSVKSFDAYPKFGIENISPDGSEEAESAYATLSFRQRKSIDYLRYEPVSTKSLQNPAWVSNFVVHEIEELPGESVERVTYRSLEPLQDGSPSHSLFVRLRVVKTELF